MKHLFTFFIFFFSLTSFAQESEWFEVGTTWTYHHFMAIDFFGEEYQSIYAVTEEVVINGTPCKKIERMGLGEQNLFGCFAFSGPYYVYESNDSVFFANDYDDTFRLAYNFSAEVGDSWIFEVPVENFVEVTTYQVTVSAIDTEMIDGQSLRSLTLDYEVVTGEEYSSIGYNSLQVVEYLGVKENGFVIPFGDWSVCDGAYDLEIQCFNSPSIDYLSSDFGSCVLNLDGVELEAFFAVYPNPADDFIEFEYDLKVPSQNAVLSIYDLMGRELEKLDLGWEPSGINVFDTRDLPNGVYIYELLKDGEQVKSGKFVIQH